MKWEATSSVGVGIQKDLGSTWGKLRLNAQDIFVGSNYFGAINLPDQNFNVRGTYQFAERVVRLSYSNTFGNGKLKSARNRQSGVDEKQRVQSN